MAKPKSHKGQHWVPASYLSAWVDPDKFPLHEPFVHIFRKDGSGHKSRAPKNIFRETDLYTVKLPDGQRDLRLEHGLSGLEKEFVRIRRKFLTARRPLPSVLYAKLIVFVSAMHARTPMTRDHHATHWREVEKIGNEMEEWIRTATPEEKKRAASASIRGTGKSMHMDQVRNLAARPMQHLLTPLISAVAEPLVLMMQCTVFCTSSAPGFITSDRPVVWFDPEAYKRPPMFRTPAFMYETLEITFPVSPEQMLFFCRGRPGVRYLDISDLMVADLNRRTRGLCHEHFVVSRNFLDPFWFDPGALPDDAWGRLTPDPDANEN